MNSALRETRVGSAARSRNWRGGTPSFWRHHTFGSPTYVSVGASTTDVVVQPVTEDLMADVADMRAAAAFEEAVFDRLAPTKKKKFAHQELSRLQAMHVGGTGDARCLVAVVDGKAVGSVDVSAAKDEAIRDAGFDASSMGSDGMRSYHYVDNVVVREEWRGQGIGSALMAAVEEAAVSGVLLVRVELNNTDAVRLYSRMGYVGDCARQGSSTVGVFCLMWKSV